MMHLKQPVRIWAAIVALALPGTTTVRAVEPANPYESGPAVSRGRIDELVFAALKAKGIEPAGNCSDAVFIRRVYFDVIGTLPAASEVRAFLADPAPGKRAALIDQLLARREYADYWALKWADLLRVKAEFPINLWPNSVQAYDHWLREAVRENMPLDRFARELLTASGSNFRVPQANFYRAVQNKEPATLAQAAALAFMGTRLEKWPKAEADGLAAFFARVGYKQTSEWKEEIVFFDAFRTNAPASGVLPGGAVVKLNSGRDPREVFADWLLAKDNPWFARSLVNRACGWLLGRGSIEPVDDIRPDNPPANPALLAHLEREFRASGCDMKHLFRQMLNSQTYQLSPVARSDAPEAATLFAFYPMRRLDAEVLIDALCQITGTTEEYSSPIPEPFTFIPRDHRSIQLPDGSITSSFLEMFGRPPRDTGLEEERSGKTTAAQSLHLLNSSHVRRKIEQGDRMKQLLASGGTPREVVTRMYLTILSRYPTDDELRTIHDYAKADGRKLDREAAFDLAWALINSPEFSFKH